MSSLGASRQRRRGRCTSKGVLLLACLTTTVFASSSTSIRGDFKIPPPPPRAAKDGNQRQLPPPPPPKAHELESKEDKDHKTAKESFRLEAPKRIPPPPPPKTILSQQHERMIRPPPPPSQQGQTSSRKSSASIIPPPPKRLESILDKDLNSEAMQTDSREPYLLAKDSLSNQPGDEFSRLEGEFSLANPAQDSKSVQTTPDSRIHLDSGSDHSHGWKVDFSLSETTEDNFGADRIEDKTPLNNPATKEETAAFKIDVTPDPAAPEARKADRAEDNAQEMEKNEGESSLDGYKGAPMSLNQQVEQDERGESQYASSMLMEGAQELPVVDSDEEAHETVDLDGDRTSTTSGTADAELSETPTEGDRAEDTAATDQTDETPIMQMHKQAPPETQISHMASQQPGQLQFDATVHRRPAQHEPIGRPETQWSAHHNSQSFHTMPSNPNSPQRRPRPMEQPAQHWQGPPPQQMQRPVYQQQMSPHTQQPPQRRGPHKSATGATWKTLWNKVEKGLDGLANLEDSVTGRAQQLVSSAVGGTRSRNPGRAPSQQRPPAGSRPAGVFSSRSSKKKEALKTAPASFTPYGQKYAVAAKQNALKEQQAQTSGNEPRQVDWNNLMAKKVISANGGAAGPDNNTPPTPQNDARTLPSQDGRHSPGSYTPMQQSSSSPQTYGSTQAPPRPQQQQGHGPPLAATSSQQPRHPGPYGQKMNPTSTVKPADPHARASRIPWDSSVPSKQGSPRPRPNQPSRPRDDDEKPSFLEKISNSLPSLPRIPSPGRLFRKKDSYQYGAMDAWKDDDSMDEEKSGLFGFFRRKPKTESGPTFTSPRPASTDTEKLAPPLASIMERCDDGKSSSLLSDKDRRQARWTGRYLATSDGITTMFLLLALQQLPNLNAAIPTSIGDIFSTTFPKLGASLLDSMDTWAPFLFVSAYLTLFSAHVWFQPKLLELESSVASAVQSDSQYSQLYLRLATALPVDPRLPMRMRDAAASQIRSMVSIARLRAYAGLAISILVLMTVSLVGTVFATMTDGLWQLVLLEQWRSWPIEWKALGSSVSQVFRSVYLSSEALIARALTQFLDNPLKVAFHLSIAGALVLLTILPRLEEKRLQPYAEDDEDLGPSPAAGIEQLAKLGASSASRLSLLSENFSIENALERWRLTNGGLADGGSGIDVSMMLRSLGYNVLTAILCISPLVVAYFVGALSVENLAKTGLRWDSPVDVSVILLGAYCLVNRALRNAMDSSESRPFVKDFLDTLSRTVKEMKESNKSKAGIQFMSSVSPTAGLQVRDLWASHTSKRAWAVKGANFVCRNGEVLAVVGDDEAGKTRLLTAILENLIFPPKRCLTTSKVRGSVSVGGVDGSKWDQPMLKRRLGILLSDVRTLADTATLFSGWTMEELLEPVDGLRSVDPSHRLSSSERSSIALALKITGLHSTLLPKLPSKLATVVTANEEDIHPSVLRAGCSVLSPAVWSKVILAKVIAQTVFDNDNAASSSDKVENCLMGSVLILDDPTILLSEVEEAKLLGELRKTGAATVFSTNKWATGRFADYILVVRDGAVVESGTHNELLARGPQQSMYAAKWHAMTMQ